MATTNVMAVCLNYTWSIMLACALFAFLGIFTLRAAPDPDLFDGRVSAAQKNSSGIRDKDGKKDGAGEIDMEGSASSGSSVEATSDGASGEASDSQQSVRGSSTVETTQSANGSGRSFEEFEIGVIDEANSKVDVNRSKEFNSQPASTKSSSQVTNSDSDMQNSTQEASESNSGNQQSHNGKGEADYGSNVPSGL